MIRMDLRDKTVLVTGAAKRVGREIALFFASKGAHVFVHYNRSATEAEATCAEIRALGVESRAFRADLTRVDEVVAMARSLPRVPDVLVNCASAFYKTPLADVTEADWEALVGSNLKGPFFLSREIGTRMAAANGGRIVSIADWSAFRPYRDYAPYCAAKGGLVTLTKALARELAPKVLVNAVAPGPILPPPDMDEEQRKKASSKTVLGRWGSPRDIANAVAFLCESDFTNGTVLFVDGGRSIAV